MKLQNFQLLRESHRARLHIMQRCTFLCMVHSLHQRLRPKHGSSGGLKNTDER